MKIQDRIIQLERQRATELRAANYLFTRTKRDVRRKLSPDRAVRKHIGVAIALAAITGMVLAPAPRYRAKEEAEPRRSRGRRSMVGRLARLAGRVFPSVAPWVAGAEALGMTGGGGGKDGKKADKGNSRLVAEMMAALAPIIGTQVDWHALKERGMQELHAIMGSLKRHHDAPPTATYAGTENGRRGFDDPEDGD